MPPAARIEKERRLKAILAFATELESQLLTSATTKNLTALSQELEKQLASLPGTFVQSKATRWDEIDGIGTRIWNLCTRLRREYDIDKPQDVPFVLLLARVFAFLLLDCAYQSGKSESSNLLRLMKTGVKAAKSCLEGRQHPLAVKVLEKVAGYETLLQKPELDIRQEGNQDGETLVAEYFVLRTVLAWRQDQLQIAELMFKKCTSSIKYFDPHTAESLADVLYEMGKELFSKQQYNISLKWLERAYEVLESRELDKLSMDACELRISIIQMSVKALLALKTLETTARAQGLIKLLQSEVGDKLIVLLLKLEYLSSLEGDSFDSNSYYDILHRMVRTVSMTESNFRLLMFHIKKISEQSPSMACNIIDDLLNLRLVEEGKEEWIEKAIITRLWIVVGQKEGTEVSHPPEIALPPIVSKLRHPLRPAAAHAAHMLLWKKIDATYAQEQHEIAATWCRLALHQVFAGSGESNIGRISRKLLLCALAKQDLNAGKDVFNMMPETAKNDPTTRVLMYKIAIRCGDFDLAAESLSAVSIASIKDPPLLYACCLDAQQAGNKEQMLKALQLVLENYVHKPCISLHLPSLVRMTIGLLESIVEEHTKNERSSELYSTVEKMCAAFESAAVTLQKSRIHGEAPGTTWSIDELDWFSKHSYNIAIRHLSSWHPGQSMRVLVCCITFIDCYPTDIGDQMGEDLTLRKMFCEFCSAAALVSMARGEDSGEVRLQDYLSLRKHVDSFDALLQTKLGRLDEDADQDLRRKFSILAAFDFEAACQLKDWDSLSEAIAKANLCKNCQIYEVMADCILCSEAPTRVLVTTLKTIVNEVWSVKEHDVKKLAKYMRCLFQITLSENTEIAEQLLGQISSGAERNADTENSYPTEELEWIATKAFNHAVDLYCTGDDESCRIWVAQAMKVAHYCSDDGTLEKMLHTKLAALHLGPV